MHGLSLFLISCGFDKLSKSHVKGVDKGGLGGLKPPHFLRFRVRCARKPSIQAPPTPINLSTPLHVACTCTNSQLTSGFCHRAQCPGLISELRTLEVLSFHTKYSGWSCWNCIWEGNPLDIATLNLFQAVKATSRYYRC